MFSAFLSHKDAVRVSLVLKKLSTYGFSGALTGGVAMEIHLVTQGRATKRRSLNDLDFVIESFASIPPSLAQGFLFHHVHPDAPEGKTLLQLIDQEQRLRIDLFRQYGATLARAENIEGYRGPIRITSLEDLVARNVSLVTDSLQRGCPIDIKHAQSFRRLVGLGDPAKIDTAWSDHRQAEAESFQEAVALAHQLLERYSDLVIREEYSTAVTPCPRCQDVAPFQRALPDAIVGILGHY